MTAVLFFKRIFYIIQVSVERLLFFFCRKGKKISILIPFFENLLYIDREFTPSFSLDPQYFEAIYIFPSIIPSFVVSGRTWNFS